MSTPAAGNLLDHLDACAVCRREGVDFCREVAALVEMARHAQVASHG